MNVILEGENVAVSAENGYIYLSSDFGKTWTQSTSSQQNWVQNGLSCDSSGKTIAAVVNGGYIYINTNFGFGMHYWS